jgi:cobalt/nickel transport system permease protein
MYPGRLEYKTDPLGGSDGRCRLLSALVLTIAVLASASYAVLGGLAFCCLVLLIRELRTTLLRLVPVNGIAAALWLPVAFGFDPSRALLYTLRINCAALLSMCLVVPMGISLFAAALAALKAPRKLIALFILSFRYIFLLSGRLSTALASMRLRCTIQNDRYRWRSLAAVFASVLTSAVYRGKIIGTAMVCRGFDGTFPATVVLRWKLRDSVLLAACVAFSVVLITYERGIWKSWF